MDLPGPTRLNTNDDTPAILMTSTVHTPRLTHGSHVPALDGIRGLAVALVMFQHFFQGCNKGTALGDQLVFGLASRSWMGVDLFFVLSGFLITGILWDTKGSKHYFKNFYARRMLRIFPAYYAVLLVFFVVIPLLSNPGLSAYVEDSLPDQIWHWTYLSNFRIAWQESWYAHLFPNVFWSLAIEEQFYLIWPLVVFLCKRRALYVICAGLLATSVALRIALAIDPDTNWITSFVLTPTRMDGLVVGASLALLLRSDVDHHHARKWFFWIAILSALVIAALTSWRPENWRDMPLQTLRFLFVATLGGAILWLSVTGPKGGWLQRAFSNSWMRVLGKYSYALYLWHGPAKSLARSIYDPNSSELLAGSRLPAQFLFVAIATTLSLAIAWLSWHLLERHFLRLKGTFSHNQPQG